MGEHYNANGDMVVGEGDKKITLRRVGWLINGGVNDGKIVDDITEEHRLTPHGGFSPVYVQVEN